MGHFILAAVSVTHILSSLEGAHGTPIENIRHYSSVLALVLKKSMKQPLQSIV